MIRTSFTGLVLALPLVALAGEPAPAPAAKADEKPAAAAAKAELGSPAPDFTLMDHEGKPFSLAEHRGKTVVLEWFNPECPFVRYAHTKGPLKTQGNLASEKGVVWVAINSGAPGKQGAGAEKSISYRKEYGMSYRVLLDEKGEVGRLFGARTTPHMFVIDPKGTLAYRGAIDNAPMGEAEGGSAVNHVEAALADLAASRPVARAETQSYGCSVKY